MRRSIVLRLASGTSCNKVAAFIRRVHDVMERCDTVIQYSPVASDGTTTPLHCLNLASPNLAQLWCPENTKTKVVTLSYEVRSINEAITSAGITQTCTGTARKDYVVQRNSSFNISFACTWGLRYILSRDAQNTHSQPRHKTRQQDLLLRFQSFSCAGLRQ